MSIGPDIWPVFDVAMPQSGQETFKI